MQRRRFMQLGLAASAAVLTGDAGRAQAPGRVVAIGDLLAAGAAVPRSNREAVDAMRLRTRLTAGMEALLGPDPWRRLFRPSEIVAIKINGLASGDLSPHRELVWAIVAGLRGAGLAPGRIIIWDRTTRELERCGFPAQTEDGDVRIYGTDALRGGGYGEEFEQTGSVGSLVSRIISHYADALINVGVLKDHDLAGISAGLKNLYGVIHNPNRYHDHACDPYVADVLALPSVQRTLRLTVIDALLGQCEGGPAYAPAWIWPCNRILVATDPVAIDAVAADLIHAARARQGLPPLGELGREPTYITTAASRGLGRMKNLEVLEI